MLTKNQKKIYDWLLSKPGYLKKSASQIPHKELYFGVLVKDIKIALIQARLDKKLGVTIFNPKSSLKVTKSTKKKVKITNKPQVFKRLFFDIETSFNVVASWRVGYKLNIGPESIIKERAIICVSYKWAGDSKIHSLKWDNGNDKQLLIDFIKVLNQADEILGHNSNRFDIKWLRTRCVFHGVPMFPSYQSVDTLNIAKAGFYFNSNKLDYLGRFLGFGGKKETGGLKLWNDIIFNNNPKSMKIMQAYCNQDVSLLEKVYNKLNPYTNPKTHVGATIGNGRCSCPGCGSKDYQYRGIITTSTGIIKQRVSCNDCDRWYRIPKGNTK